MSDQKQRLAKKYEDVQKRYDTLYKKKYKGVRVYHEDYIVVKIAEEFYLSPRTIENILYGRKAYYLK